MLIITHYELSILINSSPEMLQLINSINKINSNSELSTVPRL